MTNPQTNPPASTDNKGLAGGAADPANRNTFVAGTGAKGTTVSAPGEVLSLVASEPGKVISRKISDEQVQLIKLLSRSGLSEKFWAFAGVALGSFIPALTVLYNAFIPAQAVPMNVLGLFIILTFFIPFGIAVFIRQILSNNEAKSVAGIARNLK